MSACRATSHVTATGTRAVSMTTDDGATSARATRATGVSECRQRRHGHLLSFRHCSPSVESTFEGGPCITVCTMFYCIFVTS